MKTAAAIPSVRVADCAYNGERIAALVAEAAGRGVEVVLFPELSVTGYTCGDLFLQPALLAAAEQTLAELLRKGVGPDWQTAVNRLSNLQSRLAWLVEQVERLTGLDRFGTYLTLLFEVDMLFGNEDRHLNNIAVLRCGDGFDYCPIFDFGAGLLSNTRDYPMEIEPDALVRQLKAQPMKTGFVRQVHAAQNLYGPQLRCDFAEKEIMAALSEPLEFYAKRDVPYIRDRVTACIKFQRKKLF